MVGMGVQILATIFVMVTMMLIFFSNVALRPYTFVLTGAVLALVGWLNGYTTARLLKIFGSEDWIGSACMASFCFPCWLISTLSVVDVIEWDVESSSTIPYSGALGYILLWLCFTIPVCMHGAFTSFMDRSFTKPKVNMIYKVIPE